MDLYKFYNSTGVWLIGDLIKDEAETFVLKDVRVLQPVPMGADGYSIQLLPFDLTSPKGEIEFHVDSVNARPIDGVSDTLEREYLRSVTDLEIATSH